MPVGVSGEIYLGGSGLARGYWNKPDLTAGRFIPNPFGAAGSRIYRTGDLGRYRDDGEVEFLGRIDRQVKIRGHRIEPGDVESAIRRCAGVSEAVVVTRAQQSGAIDLVAYVVGARGRSQRCACSCARCCRRT